MFNILDLERGQATVPNLQFSADGLVKLESHRLKIMKASIHHVNVTVPKALEAEAKHFYGVVMNLKEVPKPEESRGRGGAWYQLGPLQLHLSIENDLGEACISKRHVCYTVEDLKDAEQKFRDAGVEILPDDIPTPGWNRFYVRDPGGNRLEIAQSLNVE